MRYCAGAQAAPINDAGNVFEHVSDVRLSARHSAGVGLRWASPVGLIRLDLAFPIGRRPGEGVQRIISLGQAF